MLIRLCYFQPRTW